MKAEASSVKATGKEAPQVSPYMPGRPTGCTKVALSPKSRPFSVDIFRYLFASLHVLRTLIEMCCHLNANSMRLLGPVQDSEMVFCANVLRKYRQSDRGYRNENLRATVVFPACRYKFVNCACAP